METHGVQTPPQEPNEEQALAGGGTTSVVRVGDTVRRPAKPWSHNVHDLLAALRTAGCTAAPVHLGFDEAGREMLQFVEGEVGHYPWTPEVGSISALQGAAELLRRYHDAQDGIAQRLREGWQFPALEPVEVICHNDFAPYNCVFVGTDAVGIIDFDAARPGPRAWDLAYALYRFSPFTHPDNDGVGFGSAQSQGERARTFLEAYGCSANTRRRAMDSVIPRLQALIDFMNEQAAAGDENFQGHIDRGDLDLYIRDIDYLRSQSPQWWQRVTD